MSFLNKLQSHLPTALGGGDSTRPGAGINGSHNSFESKEDEAGIVPGQQRAKSRPRSSWAKDDGSSRFNLIARSSQVFFSFIGLCIYIALAAFQSKWNVGPSFMTGFGLAIFVISLIVSGIFLATPLLSDRLRALRGLERLYRQPRVAVILNGFIVLLIVAAAIASTVSSQAAGCKDTSLDPHAELEGYLDAFVSRNFCRNKRAAAAFFWFTLIAWCASLAAVLYAWYLVRKYPQSSAFAPPSRNAGEYDDEAFDAHAADGDLSPYGQDARKSGPDHEHDHEPAPGYRPSFGGDSYPYFDDQQQAPGYEAAGSGARHAAYRDPFEDQRNQVYDFDQEDDEARERRRRYEAADPYDAIRRSMDPHAPGQQQQGQ